MSESNADGGDATEGSVPGMSASDADGGDVKEGSVPSRKQPYLKPAYRSERVFERMALSCGKISPIELQCRFNRKNS